MKKLLVTAILISITIVLAGIVYWQRNVVVSQKEEAKSVSVKEETDSEILNQYKTGQYTVIAKKVNPYDKDQELSIITFHDYEKFNEPPPVDCGTHATSCYIFLKTKSAVEVVGKIYSVSSPFSSGLEGDFIDKTINNIPVIQFPDKEMVILRSIDSLGSGVSYLRINLKTKEIIVSSVRRDNK